MERTSKRIETKSVAETQALAAELPPGTVLCLRGDLGADKTCFV